MYILNELLPDNVRNLGSFGNLAQKNARYKAAVCRFLRLRFHRVDGAGDCFFLSVCVALQATLPAVPENLADKDRLRAACIQFLRTCEHSQLPLSERVVVEMEAELNVALQASNRQTLRDTRIHGFQPNTIQDYLDASAFSGVWVAGYHWLRAVSTIAGVRIGVIIYGHDSIVYFGHGTHTIYLYKVQVNRGIMIILHLICPLPSSSMQKLTLMRWCHNLGSVSNVHHPHYLPIFHTTCSRSRCTTTASNEVGGSGRSQTHGSSPTTTSNSGTS